MDSVGLLDLIIGAIGFAFTILELRRTKSAVAASKAATERTLEKMSDRLTIADVTLLQSTLREVQGALRSERYETAVIRTQECRKLLHQLKARRGFSSSSRLAQIQQMLTRLAKLQARIEKRLGDSSATVSIARANDVLSNFIVQLSEWSEQITLDQRSQDK